MTKAETMIELLGCPFCGSEPKVYNPHEIGNWRIYCGNDISCQLDVEAWATTYPQAAIIWNTRPDATRIAALEAEATRWREVARELAGALTPFQPAYEAFVRHVQTASVKGETGFERRASSGEIGDRAFELAFDEMTSITFDQLHAVDAALARFKQESGQ